MESRILLTFEPGERLNVAQIVSASTLSRTAVSHHLKVLQQCGALAAGDCSSAQDCGKELPLLGTGETDYVKLKQMAEQ